MIVRRSEDRSTSSGNHECPFIYIYYWIGDIFDVMRHQAP